MAASEGHYVNVVRRGAGVAQRLRRHPVLTIRAMKIAAHHAEAVGKSSRIGVKKWLLFDRIALRSRRVSPRRVERSTAVVADLADTGLAFGNGAAMAASEAADSILIELFVKTSIGLADSFVENGAQGGHGVPLIYFNSVEGRTKKKSGARNALRRRYWCQSAWGPSLRSG